MDLVRTKKIVTLYGANGVGKTTLSIKLAQELSNHKNNNVLVIFADPFIADIASVVSKPDKELSIGKLLDAKIYEYNRITNDDLYNSIQFGKSQKIGYMGYAIGEIANKYPEYSREIASKFLDRMISNSYIDYIIVDCCSDVFNSVLSSAAISKADIRLLVTNANYKSVDYMNSVVEQLKRSNYNFHQEIIINNYKPNDATDALRIRIGGGNFNIEHDENIELQYIQGELHKSLPLVNKVCKRTVTTLRHIVASIDFVQESTNKEINKEMIIQEKISEDDAVTIVDKERGEE